MRYFGELLNFVFMLHFIFSVILCCAAFIAEPDALLCALVWVAFGGSSTWLYSAKQSAGKPVHVAVLGTLTAVCLVSSVVVTYRTATAPDPDNTKFAISPREDTSVVAASTKPKYESKKKR